MFPLGPPVCHILSLIVILSPLTNCVLRTEGNQRSLFTTSSPKIDYKVAYFDQKLDHFGFSNQKEFKQRYLVADQFWDGKGPIFFYAGNEGDITWFCNNTGLMWDWAPEFKALLIFAEHRYYGESMPYGTDSYKDLDRLGYLTTEQALADFVTLLDDYKKNTPGAGDKPVVAFGGSYGGMLAAWLRIKYPHVVVGSLAASAPVWQFGDLVPCEKFYQIVSNDFKKSGTNCDTNIRKSWDVINDMGKSGSGKSFLKDTLHLCQPLETDNDITVLKLWLSEAWVNLAMVDYPYPANFLEPLPAWPIKEVCKHLSGHVPPDHQLIKNVYAAVNIYFNSTGNTQCFNTTQQATASLGDLGWGFQACTEMVMPMCSDGVGDMFEPTPWDIKSFSEGCKAQWWGVETRPQWAIEQYGGKNIQSSSNIIFSNGLLDPWSGGGVMKTISPSVVSIIIPEGAHHLDLRSADPEDPPSVVQARAQEKAIIQGWIRQFYHKTSLSTGGGNMFADSATGSSPDIGRGERPVGAIVMSVVMSVVMLCGAVFAIYFATRSHGKSNKRTAPKQPKSNFTVEPLETERQPLLQNS